MPSRNGARKARPKRMVPARPDAPVVLTQDEQTGLKNRYEAWSNARALARHYAILAGMAQESYVAFATEVARRHSLPDQYDVNLATGVVTPKEPQPDA